MSFDDYFFVSPTFLRGAARVLDIGGHLDKSAYLISSNEEEADVRALASDWRVVGKDLRQAFSQLERVAQETQK